MATGQRGRRLIVVWDWRPWLVSSVDNGRTDRALATLIVAQQGFDTKRFFALDEYYSQDRTGYYAALRSVDLTSGDLTEWLEYFVQGIAVHGLLAVEGAGRATRYRLAESES